MQWFFDGWLLFNQVMFFAQQGDDCQQNKQECINAAFEAGAGVAPNVLSGAISGIILTMVIIWVAWLAMAQYHSFAKGEITFFDMLWRILRAVIVLALFSVFIK